MKKILIVLGSLVALFLAAIIVIPLVVDVDKYRPQIVKTANEKINGTLELGKLDLSLWGSIRVEIAGLSLADAKGAKLVSVKDAFVSIPWTSIFGGAPMLVFNMDSPEVRVIRDAAGKMNVMTLMKEAPAAPAEGGAPAAGAAGGETELPAMATNARLGVDVRNALFYFKDEASKSETVTKNLNLRVKDLSLSRKTEIELSGLFESAAEKLFKISGPFKVVMNADPRVESGVFQGLKADLDANFDDIEIQAADMFYKKKGMAAQMKGAIDATKDSLTVSKLSAKFFNAEIEAGGKVTALQTDPVADLTVKSNPISLAAWNELIPMLKEYSLSGTATFAAQANGPASKLQYAADLDVKDLKAKSPMLKAEPVVNVTMKVVTDKVEKLLATMKAPGNDLRIEGKVVSFAKPKIDLKVTSQSLDLDQLVVMPEMDKKAEGAPAGGAGGTAGNAKPTEENFDAMLEPLRQNEVARDTTMVAAINAKLIQFYGVKMTDVIAKLSFRNLAFGVDSLSMKLWDGVVGMKAMVAMAPKTPTYTFSTSVAGLDLQKAVSSQMALFKNTLLGKVNFKLDGKGASLNPTAAKQNLDAKGSMKVVDANFQSIDVAKMTTEAINKALDKVGDKIPSAKGKSIKGLPDKSSKYEFIASDFTIANGRFSAPNFNAKAMKDQGLDLRGSTEVGLIDQELKADWEIIDTYNLTKARDLGFEVSGIQVPSALAEGGNPVVIPVSVACKVMAPCPSYLKVPEHFAKVAFNNTKKGATQAVKEEAKEKAKDVGKKLLKGLFK